MSIQYINDTALGGIYPQTITYTQGNGLATFRTVEFQYQSRPDQIRSYRSGSRVELNRRLAYIDVKMNGAIIRRYELTYTDSTDALNALLTSVQEFGADATPGSRGTGTALPSTQYNYPSSPNNFTSGAPPWLQQAAVRSIVADFTGDGLADVAYCTTLSSYSWYIARSTGNGFTVVGPSPYPGCTATPVAAVADFNGDGKADLAFQDGGLVWVFFSNGFGFADHRAWTVSYELDYNTIIGATSVFFGDMNGDGRTDVVYSWLSNSLQAPCTAVPCRGVGVSLSHSSSFGYSWSGDGSGIWLYEDSSTPVLWTKLIDLNGDGRADLMRGLGAPSNTIEVRLSNGSGFGSPITWFPGNPPIVDSGNPMKLWRFGDFNGDGLPDLAVLETGLANHRRAIVYTNSGNGFFGPVAWLDATGDWDTSDPSKIQVGDFNGDEKTDLVDYQSSCTCWQVHLSSGDSGNGSIPPYSGFAAPGSGNWVTASSGAFSAFFDDLDGDGKNDYAEYFLSTDPYSLNVRLAAGSQPLFAMSSIASSLGGMTVVGYLPRTIAASAGPSFRSQVVSYLVSSNGMGNVVTTTYSHQNGKFDVPTREFRGFGEVTVTDSINAYAKTTFLQTNELRGKPSQVEVYSAAGALYAKTVNIWQYDLFTGVPFQFLKQADVYTYDGGAAAQQTRTVYYHDDVGNVVKIDNLGDVSTSQDDSYHWVEHHNTTGSVHARLPIYQATTRDSLGAELAGETDYFYDNATLWYTAPTAGNLTKVCRVDGTPNPDPCSTFGYDVFGNRTAATDPNGHTSTVTLDTTYHTYPVTETNALSQTGTNGYDALWRLTSVTDPNNVTTSLQYDALHRTTAQIVPPDTSSFPTTVYTYYRDGLAPEGVRVQRRETVGGSTLDAYSFVDGFGRAIQSKSEAADGTSQTVVDTTYNNRGLVETISVPYLSASTSTYTTPNPGVLKTTMLYDDPLGRVTRVTGTDGTYASRSYEPWVMTFIDANGRKRVERRDAFGQLRTVEEYTGADGRAPGIPASTYTLYATTSYSYDIQGNLTQTTDHLGNVATMTYDLLGRKIAMHDPDMGDWSYGYDLAGNLTSQTDAKGQATTFTYDQLHRIKTKLVGGQTTTYTYDTASNGVGRLASVTDPTGSTSVGYDQRGRTTQTTKVVGTNSYTLQQSFDSLNRLNTLTYPDSETVSHGYDPAGRLKTVGSYVTDISYNAFGQPASMTFGNGAQTTYAYHPTHFRLEQLNTTGFSSGGSAPTALGFESCTAVDADPPGWSVSAAGDTGCMGQPYQGAWSVYAIRNAHFSQPITLVGGTTYTVSVYARAASGQGASLMVSSLPGGGTTYCSPPAVTVLTWTLMTCSYTPSATTTAYISLKATTVSASAAVYFDLVP